MWKIINGERKRKRRANEGIEMDEWKRFFTDVLDGMERRVRRGREEGRERNEESELGRLEIERVVSGMKNGETAGGNEIASEVWKFGGGEMREWVWEFWNRIWKGQGWSESWKEGIVIPLIKKGERKGASQMRTEQIGHSIDRTQ